MWKLIFILAVTSLTALAQEKVITKDHRILTKELESRQLVNLETDSSELVYRIWIEPDLVIEVGRKVIITLYYDSYDKRKNERAISNVEKIVANIDSGVLLRHFETLNLKEWERPQRSESLMARGMIHDGHKIVVEFSTKLEYRSFILYRPLTDQSESAKRTIDFINFLNDHVNPDPLRIDYYNKLASTNKDARRLSKEIVDYKKDNRELIEKKVRPKMWGYY